MSDLRAILLCMASGAPAQGSLPLPFRGGRRRGAGRKPAGERAGASHARRETVPANVPVHVTVRVRDHVWNLRSERSFRVIDRAFRGVERRGALRVVHFSVQGNHLHAIVESDGDRSFESGTRSLTLRLALGLNRLMGRKGAVLEDRFDAHVLRTPAEVRNAMRYVLGNFESHAVRRGALPSMTGWVDPFSSASGEAPLEAQGSLFPARATSRPRGWLLRHGDRRAG